MEQKKPPHRKQIQAPGRKPPQKIDKPRTLRVDPDVWDIVMAHAVKLSGKKGYIVSLKEALSDIVRGYVELEEKHGNTDQKPPDSQ